MLEHRNGLAWLGTPSLSGLHLISREVGHEAGTEGTCLKEERKTARVEGGEEMEPRALEAPQPAPDHRTTGFGAKEAGSSAQAVRVSTKKLDQYEMFSVTALG